MFPLAMAGLVATMVLALVGSVVWVAAGGGPDAVEIAAAESAAETAGEPAEEDPATGGTRTAPAERSAAESRAESRVADVGAEAPATPPPTTVEPPLAGEAEGTRTAAAPPRVAAAPGSPPGADQRVAQPSASIAPPAAAPRRAPPRRPMAPSDTTAAGHRGLAEALLAAGDTSGAIAAYSAFLVRNTNPAREREAIERLREIGGFRR